MATILIIDDDVQVLNMLTKALTRAGHDVISAENGSLGIKLYNQTPTEIVITDLIMPDKEGLELIAELKQAHSHVKILAISGGGMAADDSYLKMANHIGADRVLSKPMPMNVLVKTIDEMLPNQ